LKNGFLKKIS